MNDAENSQPESYSAAQAELDAILAELDDEDVVFDALVQRVTRAKFLIEWCRETIRAAEIEIAEVLDPDEEAE